MRTSIIAAFVANIFIAHAASGGVVFSGTFTGEDLFNDATVTFPTRTASLNGSSLVFGAGSMDFEKLFDLPIVPADTLAPGSSATISFTINLTRLTADYDPRFTVGDGNTLVGVAAADNLGGLGESVSFLDGGNVASSEIVSFLFTDAGFPSVGGSFDVTGVIAASNLSTDVSVSMMSR